MGKKRDNAPYRVAMRHAERQIIQGYIDAANGAISNAATLMGMPRAWVFRRLKALGMRDAKSVLRDPEVKDETVTPVETTPEPVGDPAQDTDNVVPMTWPEPDEEWADPEPDAPDGDDGEPDDDGEDPDGDDGEPDGETDDGETSYEDEDPESDEGDLGDDDSDAQKGW